MSSINDAEIMERVRGGDQLAFGVLVDRHKHKLVNYLTALSRSRDRADQMTAMKRDDVRRLLEALPRHEASSEFTPRVLERLENMPTRRGRARRRFVLAIAAVLVVGFVSVRSIWRERERRRAAERVEQMQSEVRDLQAELDRLRALASEAEPVLDLGGTERVEFIFDLRRLAAGRGEPRSQLVSHSPPSRRRGSEKGDAR